MVMKDRPHPIVPSLLLLLICTAADKQAAQNKLDREFGWIVDPLFTGRYPASMRGALGDELPKFTEEQKALLKGSIDFIGINIYTAR